MDGVEKNAWPQCVLEQHKNISQQQFLYIANCKDIDLNQH